MINSFLFLYNLTSNDLWKSFTNHIAHSLSKLALRYTSIIIFISFLKQLCPYILIHLGSTIWTEYVIEIWNWYLPIVIFIQNVKSCFDIFTICESFTVYTCTHELLEVYLTISVLITFCNYFFPIYVISF